MDIFVVLPDQLFYTPEAKELLCTGIEEIYIIEEPCFFENKNYSYLVQLRAAMRRYFYAVKEIAEGCRKTPEVHYIQLSKVGKGFLQYLVGVKAQINMFTVNNVHDYKNLFKQKYNGLPIKFHDSPMYFLGYFYISDNYNSNTNYSFDTFYRDQRKSYAKETMDGAKPLKGEFKQKNNLTGASCCDIPDSVKRTEDLTAAVNYINKNCHIVEKSTFYKRLPINNTEALRCLESYCKNCLKYCVSTKYSTDIPIEIISSLQIGILSAMETIEYVISYYENHKGKSKDKVSFEALENFLRYLIGIREFNFFTYVLYTPNYASMETLKNKPSRDFLDSSKNMRVMQNIANFHNKLNSTDIEPLIKYFADNKIKSKHITDYIQLNTIYNTDNSIGYILYAVNYLIEQNESKNIKKYVGRSGDKDKFDSIDMDSIKNKTPHKSMNKLDKEYLRYTLINNALNQLLQGIKGKLKYELENIVERYIMSMVNLSKYDGEPFSVLPASHPIVVKMVEECKDKNMPKHIIGNIANVINNTISGFLDSGAAYGFNPTYNKGIITYGNFSMDIGKGFKKPEAKWTVDDIATMCLRYASLLPRGQQWSVPLAKYQKLHNKYGLFLEMFASPLNSKIIRIKQNIPTMFCSLFDTDKVFGSIGRVDVVTADTIAKYVTDNSLKSRESIAILANPPYIESILRDTAVQINKILTDYKNKYVDKDYPKLYVFFSMPCWKDSDTYTTITSTYMKSEEILKPNEYHYEEGPNNKKINGRFKSLFITLAF